MPLLLGSILVNFYTGTAIAQRERERERVTASPKALLVFGISFNLLLLGFFKYTDFLLDNFNGIFGADIPLPHIVLPIGISFFTFTQIAYLVDSYRKEASEYDLIRYVLFVSYFPHLLAGPILHHKEMMPQFANRWNMAIRWRNIALGLFIFSIGLFKKVVIADTFAVWANAGFDSTASLNLIEAWATSLSYTFQLYFDFSGYTDMAIGMSLLFNIRLPINFNSPYKALSIQDFWRRWHMTLSRFLRDYLYIPLGGNRKGKFRTYNNLIITFLLGGLWHGAGWTFVFWGLLHGVALAIHRAWSELGFKMNKILAWFITFNFINITWVFFRAKEFDDAIRILKAMFSLENIALPSFLESRLSFLKKYGVGFDQWLQNIEPSGISSIAPYFLIAFVLVFFFKNTSTKLNNYRVGFLALIISIFCFTFSILSFENISEFLYFNF